VCGLDSHSRCVNHITLLCSESGKKSPSSHSFVEWTESEDSGSRRMSAISNDEEASQFHYDSIPAAAAKKVVHGSIRGPSKTTVALVVKLHSFYETVFKGPTWCKHCNNFIFGFQKAGWICQACGIEVHDKCVHNVRFSCHSKGFLSFLHDFSISPQPSLWQFLVEVVESLDQLSQMKQNRYFFFLLLFPSENKKT